MGPTEKYHFFALNASGDHPKPKTDKRRNRLADSLQHPGDLPDEFHFI